MTPDFRHLDTYGLATRSMTFTDGIMSWWAVEAIFLGGPLDGLVTRVDFHGLKDDHPPQVLPGSRESFYRCESYFLTARAMGGYLTRAIYRFVSIDDKDTSVPVRHQSE